MRRKLFHLQALRGLAASLVVFAHTVQGDNANKFWITGYFGVATFFIISGFIIYKTSANEFGSWRGSRRFIAKRLLRIFPIYWLASVIFIVLSPHRALYTTADIVDSLLLIPHYITSTGGMNPLLGQGWTLHYELVFYALFAVGLLFPRRYGIAFVAIAIISLAVVGSYIRPEHDTEGPLTLLQYWSRLIIVLFLIGVAISMLEDRIARWLEIPAPFILMLAILAIWFLYSIVSPLTEDEHYLFPDLLVIWVLCFGLVMAAVFGRPTEGRFEAIAEAFGDASYSVYLFHPFVLSALIRLGVRDHYPIAYVVVSIIAANIVGIIMYRLVETPVLRSGRRMMQGFIG